MPRLFITGTDTEVGKTAITACLAAALRARAGGRPGAVAALKPIASGVVPGQPDADAAVLARAAGHPEACWLALPDPISPHRAQERAGVPAEPAALLRWIETFAADWVLVEGAGGWRVPLLRGPDGALFEVPDLAAAVAAPVLVVAADRLGVINHTRLTVDAIRAAGLTVAGVALNAASAADLSQHTNLDDLRALLPCPVAAVPRLADRAPDTLARAGANLARDLGLWPDAPPVAVL
jgi:dethiobiotin synthetase